MYAIDRTLVRPLRREEYDRLVESGAFENERVELVNGLILSMSPQKPEHAFPLRKLDRLLQRLFDGTGYAVQVQCPFVAGDFSEPEPDLAVVPDLDYSHRHPDEALLLIEVSNGKKASALDLGEMAAVYAGSRVREYWVLVLEDRCLWLHQQPEGARWDTITRLEEQDSVTVPGTSQRLRIADLLPVAAPAPKK